ncbi:hypothetical protein EC991_004130 [Linnemannia zychae]|nr:hypothetical protein EC991_004130 [Linnemannia zychae]
MLSLLFQVEQANEDLTSADRIWGGIRYLAERCREDLFAVYQPDNESDSQQKGASSGHGGDYDGLDGYQDEGEEDDQGEEGDEEAESRWMRLQEEDFEDPYRVAGKISGGDHYGSGINGINFQALDLNRDHHHNDQQDHITSTEQPATEGEGSLVLGADVLCQVNFPYIDGGILWLCAAHNEMLCNSMAAAKLRDFIKSKGGNCIPMEKSAEIQFHAREDARVFYGMLDEYKCVIKLKIGFEWEGGVTEEDLWELCQTVHSSTVRDLTIDCGGTGFGGANGGRLTFRPMLGMMCRLGFTALTVENFDGMFISPEEPLCTQGVSSRRSSRSNSSSNFYNNSDINTHQFDASSSSSGDAQFSLQDFRNATTILALPDNIQVQKLAFRHWARVPDRTAIVNLIKVLPNLTDLETMTDDIELLYESIQIELYLQARTAVEFRTSHSSGSYHHPLSHLNLLSVGHYGSKVELTLSKSSNPDVANRILNARWKTNKAPDSRLLQSVIGLETLEFTQCVRLWEHALALQRIVGCNYSTLQKVEIVCSTDKMADAWVFLKTEFQEPTMFSSPTAAALGRGGGYFGRDSSLSSVGSHPGRRISGRSDDSSQQRHHHQQRNRRPVHLRVYDRVGHSLESSNIEQDNQTILHLDQYDNASSPSSFRSQLELQCQIATRLRISQQFTNASQLDRLSQDITMIRAQAQQRFCLYEFVIYLTRTLAESAGFLEAAWKLMCQLPKALTIQIDGSFDRRLGATGGAQSAEDPSPRPHDIPGLLLDEFARLQRVGLDQNWNSWFELWMQEQLAQRALPILEYVPLQSGGFVFYAAESHQWSNASETGLEDGGLSAKVVYSLTHYR